MDSPQTETRLEPITFLRMALDVVSGRVYRWLTGAAAFALFAWVCARPDVWRFSAALAFTILVHCPTWVKRG